MEKDTSFLFSGITFNRKKFARDLARFQEKKEIDCATERPALLENADPVMEEVVTVRADKKTKRKAASDPVEGFNVFNSSKSKKAVDQVDENNEDKLLLGKKEYYRLLERDALFRKKHNIHVSGSNILSPLQSFIELKLRHSCKSYLLRNLAELGFKEPTLIQREGSALLVHLLVLGKLLHLSAQSL